MTMTDQQQRPICPHCGVEAQPGELTGMELPGIYDGVLIWSHSICGHAWPRFAAGPLHDAAVAVLAGRSPWGVDDDGTT